MNSNSALADAPQPNRSARGNKRGVSEACQVQRAEEAHHLLDGRGAGDRIGAGVRLPALDRTEPLAHVERRIGRIELVIGAGVLDEAEARASRELAAGRRLSPVVGRAYQQGQR